MTVETTPGIPETGERIASAFLMSLHQERTLIEPKTKSPLDSTKSRSSVFDSTP
jgi:hypothetical protein